MNNFSLNKSVIYYSRINPGTLFVIFYSLFDINVTQLCRQQQHIQLLQGDIEYIPTMSVGKVDSVLQVIFEFDNACFYYDLETY